ncbi:hypothetical protein BN1050_01260 [Metalysinibacillus saudimassiliensis]|uniref:Uncharacterized protein n=1 Tax=Metalysinibacillus saudimassiliensis TaxID=1461583 RepID=A0A078M4M8_9BACL|nr:hypothetical protein BN1050_01260 [Metalysinibacillus saudimassiliensis]
MKTHILHYLVLVMSIVVLAWCWDDFFNTPIARLLLNVDFLIDYTVRQPSLAEEFLYHAITTFIIYGLFIQLARTRLYIPALLIFTIFSSTVLYFILGEQAVRPITLTTEAFAGWVVIHLIFVALLYRFTTK